MELPYKVGDTVVTALLAPVTRPADVADNGVSVSVDPRASAKVVNARAGWDCEVF